MKPFILAIAALGLVGTMGTANAGSLTSDNVTIWSGPTLSHGFTAGQISTAPEQQALPSAATAITWTGVSGATQGSYKQPINYCLEASGPDCAATSNSTTIQAFFASDIPTAAPLPAGCNAACGALTISVSGWTTTTLFEFTFTAPEDGTLVVTHDDGVSLFVDGNTTNDLFNVADSAPTVADMTEPSMLLTGGKVYDLWYTAANGLPEVLETSFTAVPAPPIGHGLPVVLAIAGILFGAKLWDRSKRRSPLETIASHAAA